MVERRLEEASVASSILALGTIILISDAACCRKRLVYTEEALLSRQPRGSSSVVERFLPKEEAAGSIPVSRSNTKYRVAFSFTVLVNQFYFEIYFRIDSNDPWFF